MSIKNRTELAIMRLGIDSTTAHRLQKSGFTLSKLKLTPAIKLKSLGLSSEQVELLLNSKRPPVPSNTLAKLLFANRWVCCVCRNHKRSIVVHHIKPWADSRDHSATNLAILCSYHHGEAHTKHELEQNLTPQLLIHHKEKWEIYCLEADQRLALKDSNLKLSTWFYFNHFRLYEIIKELGVSFSSISGFNEAKKRGICNASGAVVKKCPPNSFLYSDHDRLPLYEYVSNIFFRCMSEGNIYNISDYLDKGFCHTQIMQGDIVMIQGMHTYTPISPRLKGMDISRVLRKSNGVQISSTINLENATSASSWCDWLRGQKDVCLILKVQNLKRENGAVVIEGTTLAIRSRDNEFKHRAYDARLWQSGLPYRNEEEDGELLAQAEE